MFSYKKLYENNYKEIQIESNINDKQTMTERVEKNKEQVTLINSHRYIFYIRKNTTKDDRAYLKDAFIDKTEEDKSEILHNFHQTNMRRIRANIVNIRMRNGNTTITLNNVSNKKQKTTILSFPLSWILRVENLETYLLKQNALLPTDLILLIDEYL